MQLSQLQVHLPGAIAAVKGRICGPATPLVPGRMVISSVAFRKSLYGNPETRRLRFLGQPCS